MIECDGELFPGDKKYKHNGRAYTIRDLGEMAHYLGKNEDNRKENDPTRNWYKPGNEYLLDYLKDAIACKTEELEFVHRRYKV